MKCYTQVLQGKFELYHSPLRHGPLTLRFHHSDPSLHKFCPNSCSQLRIIIPTTNIVSVVGRRVTYDRVVREFSNIGQLLRLLRITSQVLVHTESDDCVLLLVVACSKSACPSVSSIWLYSGASIWIIVGDPRKLVRRNTTRFALATTGGKIL